MFITVHAAASVIVGEEITYPPLAFIISFLFHFVLDIIPHGDQQLAKKFLGLNLSKFKEKGYIKTLALYGSLDACFLAFFLIFLFKNFQFPNRDSVVWAIIGGILPDILVALHKLTNSRLLSWFNKLHFKVHHLAIDRLGGDIPIKYGLVVEAVMLAIIIAILIIFSCLFIF
ncbi:MAG: hypothetical protein WC516_02820 [Patescibacteria group bacterium]